jgi:hypothetical protein
MVYRDAIAMKECGRVYLTQVLKEFPCDTHFTMDTSNYDLTNVGDVIIGNQSSSCSCLLHAT